MAPAARTLCQGLKIPCVAPEPNNKRTLERGALYAPEEMCLPYKIMLGNFIESIERGADTVLITGSCGPCRFGEYCELMMRTLKKLGYHVNFVVADLSHEVGWRGLLARLAPVGEASPAKRREIFRALGAALKTVRLCDRLDARAAWLSGWEKTRGECAGLLRRCRAALMESGSPEETLRLLREYGAALERMPLDRSRNPLKLAVVGEIYTIIDPFSNLYIEDKLMRAGVASRRMLSPSWWVKDTALKPLKLNSRAIFRAARPFLPHPVGGHGRECVGEAALAAEDGMDGAIQIFPMGCMPEVVAKAVLPAVGRKLDLPILTLVVDEIAGEAGYVTRLEAFLDMLESRRRLSKPAGPGVPGPWAG